MSQENVDALRAVYEEWGRGNFGAGVDLWDPDVLYIPRPEYPHAARYLGRDSVREFMLTWMEPWKNLTWQVMSARSQAQRS